VPSSRYATDRKPSSPDEDAATVMTVAASIT
jgi:hypothetical protein